MSSIFFDGKVKGKGFPAQWPQDGDVDMKALPKNLRYKLKFTLSDARGTGKADAKTTAKQERASAYVLGAALMNSAGFTSWRDISQYSGKVEDVVEEALKQVTSGRPGPVWIDIPMDIQGKEIEPFSLEDELKKAKRPLILAGGGVNCAGIGLSLIHI